MEEEEEKEEEEEEEDVCVCEKMVLTYLRGNFACTFCNVYDT